MTTTPEAIFNALEARTDLVRAYPKVQNAVTEGLLHVAGVLKKSRVVKTFRPPSEVRTQQLLEEIGDLEGVDLRHADSAIDELLADPKIVSLALREAEARELAALQGSSSKKDVERLAAALGSPSARADRDATDPAVRGLVYYVYLVLKSLSPDDAAKRLRISIDELRDLVRRGRLYAFEHHGETLLPEFQWTDAGEPLPGLELWLPELPRDWQPVETAFWLYTPNLDLVSKAGDPQSPREFLLDGGDPAHVARLASILR